MGSSTHTSRASRSAPPYSSPHPMPVNDRAPRPPGVRWTDRPRWRIVASSSEQRVSPVAGDVNGWRPRRGSPPPAPNRASRSGARHRRTASACSVNRHAWRPFRRSRPPPAVGQGRDRPQIVQARHPPEATGASVRSATPSSRSVGRSGCRRLVTSVTTNREHPSLSRRSNICHRSPPSGLPAAATQAVLVDDLRQTGRHLVPVLGDRAGRTAAGSRGRGRCSPGRSRWPARPSAIHRRGSRRTARPSPRARTTSASSSRLDLRPNAASRSTR